MTRERLGAGGILGDALRTFFQRFGLMVALSFVPTVIGFLIAAAITSALPSTGSANQGVATAVPVILSLIGMLFTASLSNSLIVLAAFDAKLARARCLGLYVRRALDNLLTFVVMSIVFILLALAPVVLIGVSAASPIDAGIAGLLIIPAILISFYLWAAFTPLVPVIVIEGAGFRALGRAWALTGGYRWRIGGTISIVYILAGPIGRLGDLVGEVAGSVEADWLPILVDIAAAAISAGFIATGIAMIYARLRSIKEGLDVESLADVFS